MLLELWLANFHILSSYTRKDLRGLFLQIRKKRVQRGYGQVPDLLLKVTGRNLRHVVTKAHVSWLHGLLLYAHGLTEGPLSVSALIFPGSKVCSWEWLNFLCKAELELRSMLSPQQGERVPALKKVFQSKMTILQLKLLRTQGIY